MGEVEGWVGRAAAQGEQPSGLKQLVVAEAPVLPTEDQGQGRAPLPQPVQGWLRRQQGQGFTVPPAAGGHHPAAVGQGGGQAGEEAGLLEHPGPVHRQEPGLCAQVVAAGGHQTQLGDFEIGAEPGDAAHIQRACGLHQHHHEFARAAHTRPFR